MRRERERERGSDTLCRVQHIEKATEVKPRAETEGVMLNTSAVGDVFI